MPHIHDLQGPSPPRFPRPTPPAKLSVSVPRPLQDGQVVETIVGPKIAALANTVKRICGAEAPPAPAAE